MSAPTKRRPSPLEIMALFDGELDPARAAEVEAWLDEHPRAAADYDDWLRELSAVGELVRDASAARAGAFRSVADDVLRQVAEDRRAAAASPRIGALEAAGPAEPRAGDALVPVLASRLPTRSDAVPVPRTPRRFRRPSWTTLATGVGLVAAAAACLAVSHFKDPVIGAKPTTPALVAASGPLLLVASAPVWSVREQLGVAVDTVDFGARMGTIFYQPGEAASATTVVWIKDEETHP